jgi:hypothetical protein
MLLPEAANEATPNAGVSGDLDQQAKAGEFVHAALALTVAAILCSGCGNPSPLVPSNATNIIAVIQSAQKANVPASVGEYAYQCFTDLDYKAFVGDGSAKNVAGRLVRDRAFMEAVLALRQMPEPVREEFLRSCRKPLRPTWTELARVSSAGQTAAGQRAERDIADAVADRAAGLSAHSPQEIEATFRGQ